MGNVDEAFRASPGPRTRRDVALLSLKGFCMGVADIIPGVSGGTVAFIMGIYDQLVDAIRSFDAEAARRLLRLDFPGFLAHVHLRFLLPLLAGIAVAILSTARLMHHLLDNHPVQIWSLFFGLIGASIVVVGRHIKPLSTANLLSLVLGTVFAYLIVGLIPVETTNALWFIFLCGAVAICAMILPGISGAFILLILGKYHYVTGALKNPFLPENLAVIAVFCAGCAVGITGFSRLLHWLLQRWHTATVAGLTGFMLGAMRKIWPWKEILETRIVSGKELVIRAENVLPPALDASFWAACALMAAGLAAVLLLERLSGGGNGGE